jgi:hypothetical protein
MEIIAAELVEGGAKKDAREALNCLCELSKLMPRLEF